MALKINKRGIPAKKYLYEAYFDLIGLSNFFYSMIRKQMQVFIKK